MKSNMFYMNHFTLGEKTAACEKKPTPPLPGYFPLSYSYYVILFFHFPIAKSGINHVAVDASCIHCYTEFTGTWQNSAISSQSCAGILYNSLCVKRGPGGPCCAVASCFPFLDEAQLCLQRERLGIQAVFVQMAVRFL